MASNLRHSHVSCRVEIKIGNSKADTLHSKLYTSINNWGFEQIQNERLGAYHK